jgi:hypothetical protein
MEQYHLSVSEKRGKCWLAVGLSHFCNVWRWTQRAFANRISRAWQGFGHDYLAAWLRNPERLTPKN